MKKVRLGKTELIVTKNAFGALPIQRVDNETAVHLLRKAYEGGINYFDTANFYTDSEEKIGLALADVRENIIISSKTMGKTPDDFWAHLDNSLKMLKTDYIDIYQFHNPAYCPMPGDGTGMYEAMLEAKAQGKIRHIGISSHRLAIAEQAVKSGLYETLQFPFSYLASEKEEALVHLCTKHDVGFICMKALSGGLITHSDIAYAFLDKYPVVPIWGIQRESELDEFLSYTEANAPVLTKEMEDFIEEERKALSGEFCRGCGYCSPCPAGIEIHACARMSLMLRRAPLSAYLTDESTAMMQKIEGCTGCGQCKARCPYGLDIPNLLKRNYEDYKTFLQ